MKRHWHYFCLGEGRWVSLVGWPNHTGRICLDCGRAVRPDTNHNNF